MSLREVLEIDITTVSRVPQPSADVPAAVFVITREDILRSGATSIPEALRLAPGLQVARINGGTWAIGIRGFADRLARSMLVLIDGRAVYSPLFAGTYWESQDTLLEDIDHIEIVRDLAARYGERTPSTASSTSSRSAPKTPLASTSPLAADRRIAASGRSATAARRALPRTARTSRASIADPSSTRTATTTMAGDRCRADSVPIGRSQRIAYSRCKATRTTAGSANGRP